MGALAANNTIQDAPGVLLKTDRLLLRRFTLDDAGDLSEYLCDERVVRYEPYPPFTIEQCAQIMPYYTGNESFWAVCLAESGKLIGNLYFEKKDYENWELGYIFAWAYWGKGYATEAASALLAHAFSSLGAHRVMAECNPENVNSWHLLARLGFRREGRLQKNLYFETDAAGRPLWQDTYIYALLREDWQRAKGCEVLNEKD